MELQKWKNICKEFYRNNQSNSSEMQPNDFDLIIELDSERNDL